MSPGSGRSGGGWHRGTLAVLLFAVTTAAHGEFPLVWDFDGRHDAPVDAQIGPGGDLWVLSESYLQGQASPNGVLLRIDAAGEIAWATLDPLLTQPTAFALRPDGGALAIGRIQGTLAVTAYDAAGAASWSRSRAGLDPDHVFDGPPAAPIWDDAVGVWRIPVGLEGDFAVISFAPNGDPLPDIVWSPPAETGRATSVLPRPKGGLLVAGPTEDASPPGWWVVALDAAGSPDWSRFEDGETPVGIFSGAFLLSADPVRVWADDESGCGLFSLRIWSLAAASGAPLWDTTWPGMPGCGSFTPDAVQLVGDRILATGVANLTTPPTSFDPVALALDAATGELEWARVFAGGTTGITSRIAPLAGSALLASTHFPVPQPGPTPLWLSAWDRDGVACGSPGALLPARVEAALALPGGGAVIVGDAFAFGGTTADDLVVQRVDAPCASLFADGFESGDAAAWSQVLP